MKNLYFLLITLVLFACSTNTSIAAENSTSHAKSAAKDLVGKIDRTDLGNWSGHQQDDYTPDAVTISELRDIANEFKIKVFMGTWCHDSKREVPRLFNILDAVGFDETQLELFALNYSKQTPNKH